MAMGRFNASLEFFTCFLQVAVITVGGYMIMQGRMNYIDLITFTLYITTFVTPVRRLAGFAEMFASGAAGLKPCAPGPGRIWILSTVVGRGTISGQSAVNAKIPIAISKWFMLE